MIECCVLVVSIVAIIVAIIAMYIAVYVAQMTTKIQFLLGCYNDLMELGRMSTTNPSYQPLLNAMLDKIVVLGDDFRNYTQQYRSTQPPNLSLHQLDLIFKKHLEKYKKYIKV